MRKDTLAQGAASASYGPLSGVSAKKWEGIFGPPEVGMYKKKVSRPKRARKNRSTDPGK